MSDRSKKLVHHLGPMRFEHSNFALADRYDLRPVIGDRDRDVRAPAPSWCDGPRSQVVVGINRRLSLPACATSHEASV